MNGLTAEKVKRDIAITHENIEALYRSRKSYGDGSIYDTREQYKVDCSIIAERNRLAKLCLKLEELS